MTSNTKHISRSIKVWSGYAITLGDNGETADAKVTLMQAPEVGVSNEYLYLDTNGDPVLIGWIEDGEVRDATEGEDADSIDEWLKQEWLRDSLAIAAA